MLRRPEDPFLRTLFDPLLQQASSEIRVTMQVALLLQRDVPRAEIAETLGISPGEVRAAVGRLRKIAPAIERDDG